MKTSDVMNIGYGRVYGHGSFSCRSEKKDLRTGNVANKIKMSKKNDLYVIHDFIKFDTDSSFHSGLASELKLTAFNDKLAISIQLSTPLDKSVKTDLTVLTEINRVSRDGNSCASFFNSENNCVETHAYISFVGYDIQHEFEEGCHQDEEISFSSSPEIEGFMNLMFQVIGRGYAITKSVEGVLNKP